MGNRDLLLQNSHRLHSKLHFLSPSLITMKFGGPEECSTVLAPVQLSFTSATISLIFALITFPGNFLSCLVIIKDPNRNLRTPFNMFVLNIATADLLVGIIDLPLSVAFHTCEGLQLFYPELIKALHMSVFVTCTASVLGICSLTFDRYIAISSPLKYRTRLTSTRVKRVTAMLWAVSILITIIYIKVDYIIYTFVYVNLILLFTVVVLLVIHCRISRILNEERFQRNNMDLGYLHRRKTVERNARVTKAFLILLVIFFLCNLPTFVFSYALIFCQTCDCVTIHILRDLGFLTLMLGSAINPFYYGLRLPHFKTALKKLCANTRCAQQSPENVITAESSMSVFPPTNEIGVVNKGAMQGDDLSTHSDLSLEVRSDRKSLYWRFSLPNCGLYTFDVQKQESKLQPVTLSKCTFF